MKCPKCEKSNKPNVRKCAYCGSTMPNKRTTTKKTSLKVKEEVKEPIIELTEEKENIKKAVTYVKNINRIYFAYVLLIVLGLVLVFLVNNDLTTTTCKYVSSSDDSSYSNIVEIKHHKNSINSIKYITKETSKKNQHNYFKGILNTTLSGLKSKDKYKEIVSSKYGNKFYQVVYYFDDDMFDLTEQYISVDLEEYENDIDSFVKELETSGFKCK